MHELSIAVGLVEAASRKADEIGARSVQSVHLRLGALSGVVREALLFSYDIATAGTKLQGSSLEIEDVPVVVFCDRCEAEKTLSDVYGFACPDCGTIAPDVRSGREIEMVAIEIPDEDDSDVEPAGAAASPRTA